MKKKVKRSSTKLNVQNPLPDLGIQSTKSHQPTQSNSHGDDHGNQAGRDPADRRTIQTDEIPDGRRVVGRGRRAIGPTVPAVPPEALGADVRHARAGPLQRPAQDGTADTGRPLAVARGVAHRRDVVAIQNDGVALGVVVGRVEGGHVGVGDVGEVGDVDDQRRGAR